MSVRVVSRGGDESCANDSKTLIDLMKSQVVQPQLLIFGLMIYLEKTFLVLQVMNVLKSTMIATVMNVLKYTMIATVMNQKLWTSILFKKSQKIQM